MADVVRRKIEKSCEATLSLGDMQFLKVKSVLTQDVEGTSEELTKADKALWHELALDLRRGMWTTLTDLGKTTEADKAMFDACRQRVEEARTKGKEAQQGGQTT